MVFGEQDQISWRASLPYRNYSLTIRIEVEYALLEEESMTKNGCVLW
jgi:hypothetical protein